MNFSGLGAIFGAMIAVVIVALLLVLGIFIVIGIFLNKFHTYLYGKGTACAFIPFAQGYLLGKLTFNKCIGWVVVACTLFLGTSTTTSINGQTTTHSLIPGGSTIVTLAKLGLLIYAIIKYEKIKKGELNKEHEAAKSNMFWGEPVGTISTAPTPIPDSVDTPNPAGPPADVQPTEGPKCPGCGGDITADSEFCQNCGTKLK